MSDTKKIVLDTNVILSDPNAINKFGKHDILLPLVVLQETDNFKKGKNALGFAARHVARQLDGLRSKGSLQKGVPLPSGGTLQIVPNNTKDVDSIIDDEKNDTILLKTVVNLSKEHENIVLVTKDMLLRIQADGVGVKTEDYEASKVDKTDLYDECKTYDVQPHVIDSIHENKKVLNPGSFESYDNEYVKLRANDNQSQGALAKVEGCHLRKIHQQKVGRIEPRNTEQIFAIDALLDPEVKLVTLTGKAGTGKSLLALAAGLQQSGHGQKYEETIVTRPIIPVGKEIGFLPGSLSEKMSYWLSPFYDAISVIMKDGDERMRGQEGFEQIQHQGILDVQAISHIRGRSIPDSFIIVDEAQSLNQLEIKTILTRAGEGSKIVLCGDPSQIDSPYLDEYSNGLAYVIDKFRGEPISGHITLTKGERSDLAELAAELL